MPVVDIQFQNDILFASEIGYVTADDAQEWVEALNQYAQQSPTPISLLVDASQATTICNDARKIFAKASDTPNVRVSAIVVNPANMRGAQHSRITAMLASIRKTHETHFFDSIDEARQFVNQYNGQIAVS